MSRLVSTLLAVATLAVATHAMSAYEIASRRTLYFESHGRDDLREWPAAIAKGARYVKIDFNFQPDPYTCAVQTRLVAELPPALQTAPPPQQFPNGCFVLAHYYLNYTTDFNTTGEVVALLNSDAMVRQLAALPDADAGLVVQMCFKNKPYLTCNASDELSAKWMALMDAFYAIASPITANRTRSPVRFVFDSLDVSEACSFDNWPLWPSTYVGSTPSTAMSDAGANAKFQMVNMDFSAGSAWDVLGNNNFYKFVNASYSYVAWEPSDQSQIRDFQESYLDFKVTPPHLPGMLMAYNSDPSFFHVLTANLTLQHSNVAVGNPKSKSPAVAYVDDWGVLLTCAAVAPAGVAPVLVECTALRRHQNARFVPMPVTAAQGAVGEAVVTMQLPLSTLNGLAVEPMSNGTYRLVFVGSNEAAPAVCVGAVWLNAASDSVVFTTSGFTPVPVNASNAFGAKVLWVSARPKPGAPGMLRVLVAAVAADGAVSVEPVLIAVNGTVPAVTNGSLLIAQNAFAGSSNAFPSDAAVNVDFNWFGAPDKDGAEAMTVLVSWAGDRAVYAAVAAMDAKTASGQVVPGASAAPMKVGVGRNPNGRVAGDGHVLLTYDSSFCYNSEIVDDDMVLFWGQKECNLQTSPIFEVLPNPVLSYVYAHVGDFVARLSAGTQYRNGFATVCDDAVLHGAFDLGQNPAPLLLAKDAVRFGDDSIADGTHWIVAALESLDLPDLVCMCGTPYPHDEKVVIDAFPARGFYNRTAVEALLK